MHSSYKDPEPFGLPRDEDGWTVTNLFGRIVCFSDKHGSAAVVNGRVTQRASKAETRQTVAEIVSLGE